MKTSMNLEHVYTHTQTCASTRACTHTHTHTRSEIRHKLPQLLLIIYFRLVATCNLYNIIYIYIYIRQHSSAVCVGWDSSGCMHTIIQLETSASILQSKISVNRIITNHSSTLNHKSAYHAIFHILSFSSQSSSFLSTATCEQ